MLEPHAGYEDVRLAGHAGAAAGPPGPDTETTYVLDQLASPVTAARFDGSLGERMETLLDAAGKEGRPVATYGTGALTLTELVGDDVHAGACELPEIVSTVEHGGESWEMRLGVAMIENFIGGLEPAMGTLPEACEADLLDAAGDVDAAKACSTTDEASFFAEGTDCRACLGESSGDYAGCVTSARCAEEAPVLESRSGTLWTRYEATLLSCAPDHTVPAYVLALPDETGALPGPFDYGRWGYVCAPFWDGSEVVYTCQGGDDTLRVGAIGLVEGIRRDGDDTPWYRHRSWYSPRITFEDGTELRWAWEAYTSGGVISSPVDPPDTNGDDVVDAGDDYYGYQYVSWGLNPVELRPDGTDPDVLDDTFARDWSAARAVKTATTQDGISILMANRSRCADGAWDDLDGDGRFRCTQTEAPVGGWLGDLPHFRWDPRAGYTYPMPVVTLGSTGLPDPEIPGGVVVQVASAPILGDPDWEGCTWDDTFVPDRAVLPDAPLDYAGAGSLTADTWRFGGHPEQDLRVLLYTNHPRGFCPDGAAQ